MLMVVKRLFDILFAVFLMLVLAVPVAVVALIIKMTSAGPVLYVSDRIGKGNSIFRMYKFRTMKTDTPAVATHLLEDPKAHLTPVGYFLRKTSIDEIPQLINIIKGDMSFVGPRPALYNQDDLIRLRTEKGAHVLTPGLTGWAQINGRDELSIPDKVGFDCYYLRNRGFLFDMRIIFLTFFKALKKEGVSH
jgi:O-antigen biosynthesis protein WbqP